MFCSANIQCCLLFKSDNNNNLEAENSANWQYRLALKYVFLWLFLAAGG
jgi:hypothetical protein